MFEIFDLTFLTLFVVSVIAAPWSIANAVNMFRAERRGRGLLSLGLALFWAAFAVYLAFQLSTLLSFLQVFPKLPFLWDLILSNL